MTFSLAWIRSRPGALRLQLFSVTEQGQAVEELPLGLRNSPNPPQTGGVTMRVRNHADAILSLVPVQVDIGQHYAFRVTNIEPKAIIALSVRPDVDPANPTFIKAPHLPAPRPYSLAVTGYVCDSTESC